MYTSPDEDRSDLFLAGAVYVLGPTVVGILIEALPQGLTAPIAVPLGLVVTIATTVLVPFLLIRYRKQRFSEFGFDGSWGAFAAGFVASLPVAVAYVLASLISGAGPLSNSLAYVAASAGLWLDLVLFLVGAVCVTLLAVYTTVKARTAFRSDARYLRPTALELSRYLVIAAVIATALLFLTFIMDGEGLLRAMEFILAPLGVAGVVWLAVQNVRGSQLTSRPVLLTPMVILAIGSIVIFGGAFSFVVGIWRGAMLAGLGLAVGVFMEDRRSALGPLGLATGLALLSPLVG
jgi:hypothetical protein